MKSEKGITLIALIVTIIVLLLLTGLSILSIGELSINQNNNSKVINEQEECKHDWVITSKWDFIYQQYQTISKCSKCGKEV